MSDSHNQAEPRYPVLFVEIADPSAGWLVDEESGLLGLIEEFADLIDEFGCWDLSCRGVDLDTAARHVLAGQKIPALACGDTEEDRVWPIARAWVAALQEQPLSPTRGEGPIEYLVRVRRSRGRT